VGRVGARLTYAALGWLAVALALMGVVVPGMPTTVFVLAASYCFTRSSPSLERWLRGHRWLGPPLRRFADGGGMPPAAKRAALGAMWTAVLVSTAALGAVHRGAAIATLALAAIGTVTILVVVRTAGTQGA
jgi:uncharacterized membrane protein YbaN (DUF454 family)